MHTQNKPRYHFHVEEFLKEFFEAKSVPFIMGFLTTSKDE